MLYYSYFIWPYTEKNNYDYVLWMRTALKVHMVQIWCTIARAFIERYFGSHGNNRSSLVQGCNGFFLIWQITLGCLLGVIGIYGYFYYGALKETDDVWFTVSVFITTFAVNYSGAILWMMAALGIVICFVAVYMLLAAMGIVSASNVNLINARVDIFGTAIQNMAGVNTNKLNSQECTKLQVHVREADQKLLDLMKIKEEEKCSICFENYDIGSKI